MSRQFNRLVNISTTVMAFMLVIPVLWEVGRKVEPILFPVVTDVVVTVVKEQTQTYRGVEGVLVQVSFNKARDCKFEGVSWYNGPTRVAVTFPSISQQLPESRLAGPQVAGHWLINDVKDIETTRAVVHHNCHPLWSTLTTFYP